MWIRGVLVCTLHVFHRLQDEMSVCVFVCVQVKHSLHCVLCMIWFSVTRLVDCLSLLSRSEVFEMTDFDRVLKKNLEKSKSLLHTKYEHSLHHTKNLSLSYTHTHTHTHYHCSTLLQTAKQNYYIGPTTLHREKIVYRLWESLLACAFVCVCVCVCVYTVMCVYTPVCVSLCVCVPLIVCLPPQVGTSTEEHIPAGKQEETDPTGPHGGILQRGCRGDDQSAARDDTGQHQ